MLTVDLVEDQDRWHITGADGVEHFFDGVDVFFHLRLGGVDDMQKQVGFNDLGQGGVETGDELMRQVADKADGIAEDDVVLAVDIEFLGPRVERGKEPVFGQDIGIGEGVHQAALAGIGIADKADLEAVLATFDRAFLALLDLFQLVLEVADALVDQAAVDFELFLTRSAHVGAGFDTIEMRPQPFQSAAVVFELGQLHREPGLMGAGVLSKDMQDQRGVVDHRYWNDFFEVASLTR